MTKCDKKTQTNSVRTTRLTKKIKVRHKKKGMKFPTNEWKEETLIRVTLTLSKQYTWSEYSVSFSFSCSTSFLVPSLFLLVLLLLFHPLYFFMAMDAIDKKQMRCYLFHNIQWIRNTEPTKYFFSFRFRLGFF